ncbi:hypothetical protein AB1Y20_021145 [Prymnesium parvum]|uniref:Rab-GAP TBC domain-containing protein n=1 Tax=Prymnesium parvum TaxID=97485 RepID=A0AB34JKI3_PRYPA
MSPRRPVLRRDGSWELVPDPTDDPRFDRYGFCRDPSQLAAVVAWEAQYAARLAQQELRWRRAPAEARRGGPHVRRLARRGIPATRRQLVWPRALAAAQFRAEWPEAHFASLLAAPPSAWQAEVERQIGLDLARTFPGHQLLAQPGGQEQLRQVLTAFSRHLPEIGYVQGLGMLAALLLVVVGAAEGAFWCLVGLVQAKLPAAFYDRSLSGCRVELAVLQELIEERLPLLAAHLRTHAVRVELFATRWFVGLFASTLPPETALRVWDLLVFEGARTLHGVALALLGTMEHTLLHCEEQSSLLCALQDCQGQCYDCERLMLLCGSRRYAVADATLVALRRHIARSGVVADGPFSTATLSACAELPCAGCEWEEESSEWDELEYELVSRDDALEVHG